MGHIPTPLWNIYWKYWKTCNKIWQKKSGGQGLFVIFGEGICPKGRIIRITKTRFDYVSRGRPPGHNVSRETQIRQTSPELPNQTIVTKKKSRNLIHLTGFLNQIIRLPSDQNQTISTKHLPRNRNQTISTNMSRGTKIKPFQANFSRGSKIKPSVHLPSEKPNHHNISRGSKPNHLYISRVKNLNGTSMTMVPHCQTHSAFVGKSLGNFFKLF